MDYELSMRYDVMNLDLKRLLYEFDLNGFVVTEGALDQELVDASPPGLGVNGARGCRLLTSLSVGEVPGWIFSKQEYRLDPLLSILFGKNYRLDHAFAVTETSTPRLSDCITRAIWWTVEFSTRSRRNAVRSQTLLTVGFALLPIKPGKGGFCCIPPAPTRPKWTRRGSIIARSTIPTSARFRKQPGVASSSPRPSPMAPIRLGTRARGGVSYSAWHPAA